MPMPRSASSIDTFVGARVAARRVALGLTQSALASRLGITFQQIQKYESGANRIAASRLHRIAQVMGVAVGYFFPDDALPPAELAAMMDDSFSRLKFMTATVEGRSVATSFPMIEDRAVRQALSRIIEALAQASPARQPSKS